MSKFRDEEEQLEMLHTHNFLKVEVEVEVEVAGQGLGKDLSHPKITWEAPCQTCLSGEK